MKTLHHLVFPCLLALAAAGALAAPQEATKELPPYVVRVLALGHEPERRFTRVEGGLFVMLPPEPDEVPPGVIYLKPPVSPVPLPARSPLARQFDRVPCTVSLNGIQQVLIPPEIPREAGLVVEREALAQSAPASVGPAAKVYEELGVIERQPGATSSLVILYNPVGSKVWNRVKANVLDTSESVLPPGSLLVYNLCRQKLVATVGSPTAGTLAPGQATMVRPRVDAEGNFALQLLLERGASVVQLVDSERGFPPGSRGFLIVYPVPISRNVREADFILFVIPPDPKPEPPTFPPKGGTPGRSPAVR